MRAEAGDTEGPVGVGNDHAALLALFESPVGVQASPKKSGHLALQALIVEVGANKLTDAVRAAAKRKMSAELKSLVNRSQRRDVKAGFTLKWGRQDPSGKSLAPGDFVIYLLHKTDGKFTTNLVKTLAPPNEAEVLKDLNEQMGAEGGFALTGSRFAGVALEKFELFITSVDAYPKSMQGMVPGKVGQMLGEVILHELGHLMGADHDAGIMEGRSTMGMDAPVRRFSEASQDQMLSVLNGL